MTAGSAMPLERWLLAGLSLLALAGAAWMALSLPWPEETVHDDQFILVAAWMKVIVHHDGARIAGLLPALVALDTLLAAGLALALSLSTMAHPWLHCLRRALAFGALAAAYFFQLRLQPGFSGPARAFGDVAAFVLAANAVIDLLMFFADYPRRIGGEELLAHCRQLAKPKVLAGPCLRFTRLLDSLNTSLDGLDAGARTARNMEVFWRVALHPAFRPVVLAVAATAGALFALSDAKAAQVASMSVAMAIAMLLPMMGFSIMDAKYSQGTSSDRRRIGWIYLGPVIGFVIAAFAHMGPMLASFVIPDAYEYDGFRLLDLPLVGWWLAGVFCFMPILIASFLLGLAVSMFYSGSIDPKLAIRRSLMVGLSAVVLTVVFVALENMLSSQMAARLGLSSQTGALISGAAAALAFAPLRTRLERMVERWLDRFMPRIEPELPSQEAREAAT